MKNYLCAIFLLMVIEAGYSASVGDEHWHLHLQKAHPMTLVIRQLNASQFVIAGFCHDCWVGCPFAPLFFGQASALVFDENHINVIVAFKSLASVLLCRVFKGSFG